MKCEKEQHLQGCEMQLPLKEAINLLTINICQYCTILPCHIFGHFMCINHAQCTYYYYISELEKPHSNTLKFNVLSKDNQLCQK